MKKFFFLCLIVTTAFTTAISQDVVFAHVSSQQVFDNSPSYNRMLKEQEMDLTQIQLESETKEREIQEMERKLQMEAAQMTEMQYALSEKKLIDMYEDLEVLKQYYEHIMGKYQQRFMDLQEMYFEAVQIVADRLGITYVFDKDAMLYAGPKGRDITEEVTREFKRMDIEKYGNY